MCEESESNRTRGQCNKKRRVGNKVLDCDSVKSQTALYIFMHVYAGVCVCAGVGGRLYGDVAVNTRRDHRGEVVHSGHWPILVRSLRHHCTRHS
jgi:hypothetical protein